MVWLDSLNGDPLSWLREPDTANPSIGYLVLHDLLDWPADDPDVIAARSAIMNSDPVPVILDAQHPEGYWQQPGSGYGKYQGTVWQIIFLGELRADPTDERVQRGCEYLLNHSVASNGGFSATKSPAPYGLIHCLNGNLLYTLPSKWITLRALRVIKAVEASSLAKGAFNGYVSWLDNPDGIYATRSRCLQ